MSDPTFAGMNWSKCADGIWRPYAEQAKNAAIPDGMFQRVLAMALEPPTTEVIGNMKFWSTIEAANGSMITVGRTWTEEELGRCGAPSPAPVSAEALLKVLEERKHNNAETFSAWTHAATAFNALRSTDGMQTR